MLLNTIGGHWAPARQKMNVSYTMWLINRPDFIAERTPIHLPRPRPVIKEIDYSITLIFETGMLI